MAVQPAGRTASLAPEHESEDALVRLVSARLKQADDPTLLSFLREAIPVLEGAVERADRDLNSPVKTLTVSLGAGS